MQASGRGTETPQQGWLLAVPLFPGSRSEINQIHVENKRSNELKREKARDPRKGKSSPARVWGLVGSQSRRCRQQHTLDSCIPRHKGPEG